MHCGGWSLIGFAQIKLAISAYSAERKWLAKSIVTFNALSSLLSGNFNFTWKNALISTQRLVSTERNRHALFVVWQDTLRDDCNAGDDCVRNCCVSPLVAPVFFVVFVLMAQFVLVNVVVAVLMKHLEVSKTKDSARSSRSARVHVRYMLSPARLSVCLSVCCLSVCNVRAPYSGHWIRTCLLACFLSCVQLYCVGCRY